MNMPTNADGFSLRDYFAGQIAAAILVAPKQPGVVKPDIHVLARMAYEQADALMKERGK